MIKGRYGIGQQMVLALGLVLAAPAWSGAGSLTAVASMERQPDGAMTPAAAPQSETLLEVSDATGHQTRFDRAALESLPQVTFRTSTLWTDGPTTFSGPPLIEVLRAAGIRRGRVQLMALNEYMAEVELADLNNTVPIIATRRDGAPFRVRDGGPLWVVYPYDADAAWRTEQAYASSVWQLLSIKVKTP